MTNVFDRLVSRPKATDTYTFAFDPNAARELNRLIATAEAAEREAETHPKSPAAKSTAVKARKAADAARSALVTVTITITEIGIDTVEQLRLEHPATPEQIEQANLGDGETMQFNPDTFPVALLAASISRVVISDQPGEVADGASIPQAKALYARMSQMDRFQLHAIITVLNGQSTSVDAAEKD